jgi:hypothetical protein
MYAQKYGPPEVGIEDKISAMLIPMRSAVLVSPLLLEGDICGNHTKEADNDPTNGHYPGASSVETIREESWRLLADYY